jgi:hypothetical protein
MISTYFSGFLSTPHYLFMPATKKTVLSLLAQDILLTLMYYDIFHYPLTKKEILHCCKIPNINIQEIENELVILCEFGYIFENKNFYSLENKEIHIQKRIENNQRAAKMLPIAYKISRFIAHFPYVRATFLSGAISKNVVPPDGDIDFFIITKPKRLWLSRTLLVMFRRIFLLNSHKYFCINYFIDEQNLNIADKNLFSATEVVYLIPTFGAEYHEKFHSANAWVRDFFPNFPLKNTEKTPYYKRSWLQSVGEFCFDNRLGDWLDEWCMKRTIAHRQKKFAHFQKADFEVALKGKKEVAKHHPNHFQKRVFEALHQKISHFEQNFDVRFGENETESSFLLKIWEREG